jgi:hypothetical protein
MSKYSGNPSVPLKEYVDKLREADRRAVDAVAIATEKRFESVNEWRGQSKDRERDYVTRNEVYALIMAAGVICGIVGGVIGHFVK